MGRFLWLLFGLFPMALSCMGVAHAQDFPVKPVRIIVPFPPGGNSDVLARIVGAEMTASLGQQVVIENRPGAGGTIAATVVAKAPADGYTILLGTAGTHGIATTLYPNLQYDAVKDFAPVTNVAAAPLLFLVGAQGPYRTLSELIAAAKAKPKGLLFGSAGMGSSGHMSTELFLMMAGIEMPHVPYKGGHLAAADLMNGSVALVLDQIPASLPQIKAGKLRAVAISTPKRSELLPDVPSAAESGVPGYSAQSWFGFIAPSGTPRAALARLHSETVRTLSVPEVRARILAIGMEPVGNSQEEFSAFIRSEIERWGRVVKAAGVKAE